MGGERTVLCPVTVKLGIGDSASVEVLEGLKENDLVVSGIVASATAASAATRSLLGGPFGGPPVAKWEPFRSMEPIIKLEDYRRTYRNGSLEVHAVRGVRSRLCG